MVFSALTSGGVAHRFLFFRGAFEVGPQIHPAGAQLQWLTTRPPTHQRQEKISSFNSGTPLPYQVCTYVRPRRPKKQNKNKNAQFISSMFISTQDKTREAPPHRKLIRSCHPRTWYASRKSISLTGGSSCRHGGSMKLSPFTRSSPSMSRCASRARWCKRCLSRSEKTWRAPCLHRTYGPTGLLRFLHQYGHA